MKKHVKVPLTSYETGSREEIGFAFVDTSTWEVTSIVHPDNRNELVKKLSEIRELSVEMNYGIPREVTYIPSISIGKLDPEV